jgi:hypothetical protein
MVTVRIKKLTSRYADARALRVEPRRRAGVEPAEGQPRNGSSGGRSARRPGAAARVPGSVDQVAGGFAHAAGNLGAGVVAVLVKRS